MPNTSAFVGVFVGEKPRGPREECGEVKLNFLNRGFVAHEKFLLRAMPAREWRAHKQSSAGYVPYHSATLSCVSGYVVSVSVVYR